MTLPVPHVPLETVLSSVEYIAKLYSSVRKRRLETFLKGLRAGAISEHERLRLERSINSEDGNELLADFAERVVRTRSQTAIAALAVLYTDPADIGLDADFKAEAAQALQGISDRAILAFLAIASEMRRTGATTPWSLHLTPSFLQRSVPVSLQYSLNTWQRAIDELSQRGLLVRPRVAAWGGESDEWERYVDFTAESHRYAAVLDRARQMIGLESIYRTEDNEANNGHV